MQHPCSKCASEKPSPQEGEMGNHPNCGTGPRGQDQVHKRLRRVASITIRDLEQGGNLSHGSGVERSSVYSKYNII